MEAKFYFFFQKKMEGHVKKPRVPNEPSLRDDSLEFFCTIGTVKETLARFGVAVIPSVLDETECANMNSGFWNFFEGLTSAWERPVLRTDPGSWVGLFSLFPMHSMLWQHFGIGHAQVNWDVRQNRKVAAIFAHLWNVPVEELIVSFDGASFHVPHETTGRGQYKGNTWYHTDQRPSDSKFMCVQGWVTALDVRPGDATLTVLRGSHLLHEAFAKRFELQDVKEDWYKLQSQEQVDFFSQCPRVAVHCPRGSLVLWDSRTMHAGQEPLKERPQPNFRMVSYVCYVPRSRATPKQLEKKKKALQDLRATSHWPERVKLFGKQPRTYGAALPPVTLPGPPVLNELGKKLAGF
jgi:hypothetical protein